MKYFNKIILFTSSLLLISCNLSFNGYEYENDKHYQATSELRLDQINFNTINLHWINGNINVSQSNTSENYLYFIEDYSNQDEDLKLHYWVNNDILNIHFVKDGTPQSKLNNFSKNLDIVIPSSLTVFNIQSVNNEITFNSDISLNEFNLEGVNGKVNFNYESKIDNIDIEVVNYNINFSSLECSNLDVEKVNGNLQISNINNDDFMDISIDSVNGNDRIYIKESQGYKINVKSFQYFSSEFGNTYNYGDEKIRIDYISVSGKLYVYKNED